MKKLSKKATIVWSVVGGFVGILLILIIIVCVGTGAPRAYAAKKTFSEREKCKVEKVDGYWQITKPDDRPLKILQVTDVHIGAGIFCIKNDKMAIDAVAELIERVKPDLVIATGDTSWPVPYSSGTINNMQSATAFAALMKKAGVPWTVTFGNHDQEVFATHSKEKMAEFYEKAEGCLFQRGDASITGVGNNVIKVVNSDGSVASAIFTIDSNSYLKGFFDYDNIHADQVEWYEKEVNKLTEQNGRVIPSLAFFHIPVTEYEDAWRLYEQGSDEVTLHYGTVEEAGNILSVPVERSAIFEKMLELGSTKGLFCGHDHLNYFSLTYKGIRLTYGMSIDYTAYVKASQTNQRGGTVITVGSDGAFDCVQEKLLK